MTLSYELKRRAEAEQSPGTAENVVQGAGLPEVSPPPPADAGQQPEGRTQLPLSQTAKTQGSTATEEASLDSPATKPGDEQRLPVQQVSPQEENKWKDMMDVIGIKRFMLLHKDRFLRRVRRGIPPQLRWQVWKAAVHLDDQQHVLSQDYDRLSRSENVWTSTIEIDIARTFPELKSFGEKEQQQLWRVLNAYAAYNPKLGYCQGMNFVAGLLLLVSDFQEEESFGVLVCLMDHVGLAGFYYERLPLFMRYLRACDMLVKETVPDLRAHFRQENVQPAVYLHQWFLTLFINCFPLSMVIIIWDVIICEGLEVVLRIAVSILQVLKDSLMAMHFEEIIKFFKMMKTYDDEDSELNAFRIGQLLMKHTELVQVPENILSVLKADLTVEDDFSLDPEESWDADSNISGTWLAGFGRMMSMFNYGARREVRRKPSDDSKSSATPPPSFSDAAPRGSADDRHGSSSSNQLSEDRQLRGWEFL